MPMIDLALSVAGVLLLGFAVFRPTSRLAAVSAFAGIAASAASNDIFRIPLIYFVGALPDNSGVVSAASAAVLLVLSLLLVLAARMRRDRSRRALLLLLTIEMALVAACLSTVIAWVAYRGAWVAPEFSFESAPFDLRGSFGATPDEVGSYYGKDWFVAIGVWIATFSLFASLSLYFFRDALFASPGALQETPLPIGRDAESLVARATPQTASPRAAHAPTDVFISYKREERQRVEAIANALKALKLNVWFDARLQSGHSFDDEINREVRGAKAVLVCWSSGAVASEWVRAEASIGRQRGVLAACFLEDCEPFPPFNLVHAEHLGAGALDGTNPAWVKIVDQIGVLVGRPGLGAYAQLGADKAAAGAWLAENAGDPLADAVLARLRQT